MDDRTQEIRNLSFPEFIDGHFQHARFERCIYHGISLGMLPFRTIGDYLDADSTERLELCRIPNLGKTSLDAFNHAIQVALLLTPGTVTTGMNLSQNVDVPDYAEIVSSIRTKYPLAFDDFLDRYQEALTSSSPERFNMETELRALAADERSAEVSYRRFLGETLEEIGDSLELTRERVRQIEARFKPLSSDIFTDAFVSKAMDAVLATSDESGFPRHEALCEFHPLLPMVLRRIVLAERSVQGNGPLSGKEQRLIAARLGMADEGEAEAVPPVEDSNPASIAPLSIPEVTRRDGGNKLLVQWVIDFLDKRQLASPDHRMLYGYNVSAAEFESLEAALVLACLANKFSVLVSRNVAFPALFVLFASEWWKREYEGGAWDWDPILERLAGKETEVVPLVRSECVTIGLQYWGHQPLAEGKRFLGAIVANGGMPMRLLAQGTGKMAGLLAQVIKFADRYQWNRQQIVDGVEERFAVLPRAYQRPEIASLLADIGEAVLHLKQEYKLGGVADPIAYLDQNASNWKLRFPISLEDDAAQVLLVGLVREASAQRLPSSHDLFRCERRLVLGAVGTYALEAHLVSASRAEADALARAFGISHAEDLPRYFSIDLDSGTRRTYLEARLLLGAEIPAITLSGRRVIEYGSPAAGEHILTLRSVVGDFGERITVPGGGALPEDDPWVFVQRDDGAIRFVAAGSARLPDAFAFIVLPDGWRIETEGTDTELVGTMPDFGATRAIYRVEASVRISQAGLSYCVRLGQAVEAGESYQWSGRRLPEAKGKPVFRGGTPSLYRVMEDGLEKVPLAAQTWQRQGSSAVVTPKEARGPIEVLVSSGDEVIGRQRIVILPSDAHIKYVSGEVGKGLVRLVGWGNVDVAVSPQPGLHAEVTTNADQHEITLRADGAPPAEFRLLVHWAGCCVEQPFWLAFPVTGGRFIRSCGGILKSGDRISIRDLIGTQLQVFDTNPSNPKAYSLQLAFGSGSREVSLCYPVPLDINGRAEVRLIDYQRTIESLLGMNDVLDGIVSVRLIVGQTPTAEFFVARYAIALERDGDEVRLQAKDLMALDSTILEQADVLASPLTASLTVPQCLNQTRSEGVLAGTWDTRTLVSAGNPWLIYPGQDSPFQFRPMIWIANGDYQDPMVSAVAPCALSEAMLEPDPLIRRDRVHQVVKELSRNLKHPSWQLINRLWERFHHLPLPALDVWRMVAKRPQAVLATLLRMDLNPAVVADAARRFRDEVGWIPELTTARDMREAVAGLWSYWSSQLPANIAKTVFLSDVEARLLALGREIPSIGLLVDFVLFETSGTASEDLQTIWNVRSVNSDVLVRDLWQGQESVGNTLLFLVNAGRENWPERGLFEAAFEAYASTLDTTSARRLEPWMRRLFWFQPADFKFSVANLPMLCALWSVTSAKRTYWSDASHRLALKRVRDFDPVWFDQGFRRAFAALLTMKGVIEPERLIDFPD